MDLKITETWKQLTHLIEANSTHRDSPGGKASPIQEVQALGPRVITGLLLLLMTLLSACSEEVGIQEIHGDPVIRVQTMSVTPESIEGKIHCFGVLEAANEVSLNVDFSAPVAEILVHEGQRVDKGQTLLRFDSEKLKLNYQQTDFALAQTESTLENYRLNQNRVQALLKSKTVSQQDADRARSNFETARARVEEMKSTLQLIERDILHSEVLSPMDAVVSVRKVEAGQNAAAFQPLLLLEAVKSIKVSVYVGESVVSLLQVGDAARVNTVAGTIRSTIFSIGAKSDPQTGNFEIKLLLDNSDNTLKPGMTADVQLTTHSLPDQLIIPQASLVSDQGRYVVYQDMGGVAKRTEVEVTVDFNDQLVVTSGLTGGETIIISGADKVSDGAPVEVDHE